MILIKNGSAALSLLQNKISNSIQYTKVGKNMCDIFFNKPFSYEPRLRRKQLMNTSHICLMQQGCRSKKARMLYNRSLLCPAGDLSVAVWQCPVSRSLPPCSYSQRWAPETVSGKQAIAAVLLSKLGIKKCVRSAEASLYSSLNGGHQQIFDQ